eukprot:m.79535 g.79535  ORF g.79535 m.79535 type:complete len:422 (-) comp8186_c0_seq1:226-1491(-)
MADQALPGAVPDESCDSPSAAAAAARRQMLEKKREAAKARSKRGGAGMMTPSDTPTRRTPARRPSIGEGGGSLNASLVLDSPTATPTKEMSELKLPAEPRTPASRFEQLMAEEGFDESYTPTSTRFDAPVVTPSSGAGAPQKANTAAPVARSGDPLFFSDLEAFVKAPAPKGVVVQCCITRDRAGLEKGMYPTYYLHLERQEPDGVKRIFLLAGRKRKKSRSSNYIISTDASNLSRDGAGFAAKLRANFVGTQFTVYDDGFNAIKHSAPQSDEVSKNPRVELAAVIYETNLLGFKGPRKMTVVLPALDANDERIAVSPRLERDTILERYKAKRMDDLLSLGNKQPEWNEETASYVLNFYGRVKMASVKNFQIVHETDPNYIIMQFGRVDQQSFSMDFQFPMSAIQAFAIALSSFDGKLACE